jgi:hypothetical protein
MVGNYALPIAIARARSAAIAADRARAAAIILDLEADRLLDAERLLEADLDL